jgi:outer membrane protein, heavy metal efflux system
MGAVLASTAMAMALAGCATYEAKPVDVRQARAQFLARSMDSSIPPLGPGEPALAAGATATPADPAPGDHPVESGAPAAGRADRAQPSGTLDLPQAERLCLIFNAQLRRARREAGVTLARAENGGLWNDPVIGVDLSRIFESVPNPYEAFGWISLTIPISGRLELEKQRLGLQHAVSLARVARMEWETRMSLRRRWHQWTAQAAEERAVGEFAERVRGVVGIVESMAERGEIARIEARLFRLENIAAQAELRRIQSEQRQCELAILGLIGLPPNSMPRLAPLDPAADPPGASPDAVTALDPAALQDRLLAGSPALAVALAEYEVAERRLEEEVRKQIPDLQVGPGYGTQDGDKQFNLGISMPLPILNANRGGIAEAAAERESARATVELELESAIGAAALRQAEWTAAAAQRSLVQDELVPLADEQFREARQVADLGELNTLALLEALKRQCEARVRLIRASRDESLAIVGLEEVVGPVVPVRAANAEGAAPIQGAPDVSGGKP